MQYLFQLQLEQGAELSQLRLQMAVVNRLFMYAFDEGAEDERLYQLYCESEGLRLQQDMLAEKHGCELAELAAREEMLLCDAAAEDAMEYMLACDSEITRCMECNEVFYCGTQTRYFCNSCQQEEQYHSTQYYITGEEPDDLPF